MQGYNPAPPPGGGAPANHQAVAQHLAATIPGFGDPTKLNFRGAARAVQAANAFAGGAAAEAKLDKMLEAEPAQPTAEALEKFFPGVFMEETADGGLKRKPGAADRGARVLTMLEDPVAPHLDLDDLSGTKPFERKRLFNMLEELGSGAARRSGNMAALLGGDSPSAGPEPEPEPEPEPASEPQPDAGTGETQDEAKEP